VTRSTEKIAKVVSLAAAEERRFGEQAGRTQQALNEQLGRLGELNAFRQSYGSGLPAASGVSSIRWKDYQSFLQRLDRAVQSQQHLIGDCERNLEAHRKRWMVKRQKLESLQRVLEKCRQRDVSYQERLEQRRLDDMPCRGNSILKPDHR